MNENAGCMASRRALESANGSIADVNAEQQKATAQSSSTAIEEKQPQDNNLKNIISEQKVIFNGKIINPLEIIDGKTLFDMELPPLRFVIENILPQGLFILAGSPKVGKSWLSLHFCKTVATGEQIWNYQGEKGKVLYLALEDNLRRLQSRLKKYTDIGIPDLFFSIRSLKIKDGLKEQISAFIKQHPETNLIIIDTLQRVRNNANDKNAYVSDYNDMNILSEITNHFNLTMILVTHNRKADDPDPLNMISGSTGLVGASDGAFVLEKDTRTGNSAKLTISNRDTEGHVFILEFNKETCYWKFIEEETETETEESLFIFLDDLMSEKSFWSGTATELCEKFSESNSKEYVPATITKKLRAGQQFLKEQYNIKCYFKTEKNTKLIKIYREKEDK